MFYLCYLQTILFIYTYQLEDTLECVLYVLARNLAQLNLFMGRICSLNPTSLVLGLKSMFIYLFFLFIKWDLQTPPPPTAIRLQAGTLDMFTS